MIEITPGQRQALAAGHPVRFIDPETRRTYVLVSEQTYERIKKLSYDDSPWTDQEMDLLAEEAGELLDRYET